MPTVRIYNTCDSCGHGLRTGVPQAQCPVCGRPQRVERFNVEGVLTEEAWNQLVKVAFTYEEFRRWI